MKKNPGRRDRRAMSNRNRTSRSDKKQAINERNMLWFSKYGPNWKAIREYLKKKRAHETVA